MVLACAHRFCYGCLSRACLYDHHCPLCKKDTDLDPSNYHIDPILTKFVDAHCARAERGCCGDSFGAIATVLVVQ